MLTIIRAVIDSFIHRFSSSKWPITIQVQRRATNILMETTDAWSDVETIPSLTKMDPKPRPILPPTSLTQLLETPNKQVPEFLLLKSQAQLFQHMPQDPPARSQDPHSPNCLAKQHWNFSPNSQTFNHARKLKQQSSPQILAMKSTHTTIPRSQFSQPVSRIAPKISLQTDKPSTPTFKLTPWTNSKSQIPYTSSK